jgi:hypothetical protein
MAIEYAGGGGLAPLRELAKATGHDLEYVVRLANRGELRRLLVNGPIRIHTPLASDEPVDNRLGLALARRASPRNAQLALMGKRFGPT